MRDNLEERAHRIVTQMSFAELEKFCNEYSGKYEQSEKKSQAPELPFDSNN